MKRIALLLITGAACALAAFALAKDQDKDSSKAKGTSGHVMLTPSEIQWMDAPPFLPPGAKMAVLEGDPTKSGQYTVRLQMPAGYKIPAHSHPTAEKVTVISGNFNLGMGDKLDESSATQMPPGSFAIMPAGMKHYAWATDESVVQVHGSGPFQIKYVNPADDPRSTKK